jgi:hypothetical protein
MVATPCRTDTCRQHLGNHAITDTAAIYRVGWYHSRGEPHHAPGCRHYGRASHWGGIGFRTRADAEAAGHPAAKCCILDGAA